MPNVSMQTAANSSSHSVVFTPVNSTAFFFVSAHPWFVFTVTVSFCGSVLLVILLASSFRQNAQITRSHGSRILLVQLMFLELILIAITAPIQYITSYYRLTQHPVTIECSGLLLVHSSVMFTANWTIVVIALNRFMAIELPHRYKVLISRPRFLLPPLLLPWMIGVCRWN